MVVPCPRTQKPGPDARVGRYLPLVGPCSLHPPRCTMSVAVAIVVVVLLAIAAGGGWYFFKKWRLKRTQKQVCACSLAA